MYCRNMVQFMDWMRDYGSVSKNKRQRDTWVSRKYLRKTLKFLCFMADSPGFWIVWVYWQCVPTEVSWGWKTQAQCICHHSEVLELKSDRGKGEKVGWAPAFSVCDFSCVLSYVMLWLPSCLCHGRLISYWHK